MAKVFEQNRFEEDACPLRACMLAYTFYESDGRVMRYAEALAKKGVIVDAIVLKRKGQRNREMLNGVSVRRIQEREYNETGKYMYLSRTLRFFAASAIEINRQDIKRRYDLIHVHSVPDFEVFAALLPRLRGAKVILDIHDIVPEFYAAKFGVSEKSSVFRLLAFVEKVSTLFAHHVIIANDLWREKITKRSVKKSKCTSFINFPDTNIFKPGIRSRGNDERFVVVYPGTLAWHQGLDVAVKAFALVADKAPKMRFIIYGEGPKKESIQTLVLKLGLKDIVSLHPPRAIHEIAPVMADADLGIVPKRNDSFGGDAFSTKTLEFMALGVPLVVADTRIDKHYFNEELLRFFKSGDEEDLARVLLDAYYNQSEGKRRAIRALEFARMHSWEIKKKEYFKIVESLTGRPVESWANAISDDV